MPFHHSVECRSVHSSHASRIGDVSVGPSHDMVEVILLELGQDQLPGGMIGRIQDRAVQRQTRPVTHGVRVFVNEGDFIGLDLSPWRSKDDQVAFGDNFVSV